MTKGKMKICRMCLKKSEFLLYIFEKSSAIIPIAPTIVQHFWFEPIENDSISTFICVSCWSKIETFHMYYLKVEEVQRKLTETYINVQEVDSKLFIDKTSDLDSTKISSKYTEKTNNEQTEEINESKNCLDKVELIEQDYTTIVNDRIGGEFIVDDNSIDADYNPEENFGTSDDEPLAVIKSEAEHRKNNRTKTSDKPEESGTKEINSFNENPNATTRKKRVQKIKSSSGESRRIINANHEKIAKTITIACDLCTSAFKTFADMKQHCISVHKVKGYTVCCSSKFYRRNKFLEHMIRHVAPDMLKCDKCGKCFSSKRALKDHTVLLHNTVDVKIFHCDKCPKRYYKEYLLNQHKNLVHKELDETAFKCGNCEKRTESLLKMHQRCVHEKRNRFICDICAKVLRSKGLFIKHKLEHDGIFEPKAQCKECGSWLKNAFNLKLHMKLHNRPEGQLFECNQCGKKSATRSAIQNHIRFVHSDERPFQCTFCDKAFKKRLTLKEHMATHTDDVLYTCPHCPKTFNSRGCMHSHRKNKHPKEWEEARKAKRMPKELLNENDVLKGSETSQETLLVNV